MPDRLYLSLQRNLSTAEKQDSDKSREVIYKGRLQREIIRVKLFSMTTSVMGLAFQPFLYSQASSLPVLIATCSVAGFFTFVTPVLLHQLAKRHVNRITYSEKEDNYIAHTTSFFFKDVKVSTDIFRIISFLDNFLNPHFFADSNFTR